MKSGTGMSIDQSRQQTEKNVVVDRTTAFSLGGRDEELEVSYVKALRPFLFRGSPLSSLTGRLFFSIIATLRVQSAR